MMVEETALGIFVRESVVCSDVWHTNVKISNSNFGLPRQRYVNRNESKAFYCHEETTVLLLPTSMIAGGIVESTRQSTSKYWHLSH